VPWQLCGYGRSDWSTKLIRGLISEEAAGFRSRRGPSHDSTLVTPHNAPFSNYKAARVHWLARRRRRPAFCIGRTKRRTGRRAIRAIGLVLLSIAIMALLLTDADAKRRSSAQGSQAAGASRSWCAVHPRHGSENCGYTSFDQCWATIGAEGGWCRPNPFSGTPYGTGYTWSGPKR
jgi:hypothetical protein